MSTTDLTDLPDAIYLPEHDDGGKGQVFVATELARGPWDPDAQHGGAPAALLARAVERHDVHHPMRVARLTIELLRPVPLGRVEIAVRTLRPGRKVQLVEACLSAGGTEVARATGLRIREAAVPLPGEGPDGSRLADPSRALAWTFERVGPLNFGAAMELAPLAGGPGRIGPATVWFRLRVPVVAGEETSPLMRVAAAADFGNGISAVVDWDRGWMFINPDLTIHLSRYPVGEWVALDAVTHASDDGVGFAEAALHDERGRIGRSVQSLLFDVRGG
jgi:Acyl-CoA thioesterase C-terminal domain/Acyl-CoA thioesterase N-terminal domain